MSKFEKSEDTESTVEEKTEEAVEETKPEVKETVKTIAEKTKSTATLSKTDNINISTGTGLEVYNGFCGRCGARIANGIVKDGKVNCPTCKQDF